ncbi:hypothetical protein SAMN05216570_1136 [Dyella sp. OK004]|nr:hypothetical protein SAMN05216570_1136 [Dyella sp. OK004]
MSGRGEKPSIKPVIPMDPEKRGQESGSCDFKLLINKDAG